MRLVVSNGKDLPVVAEPIPNFTKRPCSVETKECVPLTKRNLRQPHKKLPLQLLLRVLVIGHAIDVVDAYPSMPQTMGECIHRHRLVEPAARKAFFLRSAG